MLQFNFWVLHTSGTIAGTYCHGLGGMGDKEVRSEGFDLKASERNEE